MNKEDLVGIIKEGGSIEDVERALICKKALEEVMTSPEAATIWGKNPATVKQACQQGRFHPWEARKSQGTWLVTRSGMVRLFGEIE